MPKSIKIADDIYEYVQSKAIPFEDDFNSALRRLLDIKGGKGDARTVRRSRYEGGISTSDLEPLVLKALVQLGGSGKKAEVESIIESMGLLREEDYQIVSHGRELWKARLTHCRGNLEKKDEVLGIGNTGLWEISTKGRSRVESER